MSKEFLGLFTLAVFTIMGIGACNGYWELNRLVRDVNKHSKVEVSLKTPMGDWEKIYKDAGIDAYFLEKCNWEYGKIMNQYLKKVSPESAGFQTPIIKFFSYRLKGALDCD